MFTAVLCWIIFGIPVNIATAVAIAIVSYASLLYARNPVDNSVKAKASAEGEDEEALLEKVWTSFAVYGWLLFVPELFQFECNSGYLTNLSWNQSLFIQPYI